MAKSGKFPAVILVSTLVVLIFKTKGSESCGVPPAESGGGGGENDFSNLTVYYTWKKIKYNFPPGVTKEQLTGDGKYIQKNIAITAAKIFNKRMFVTTPRYQPGVPATFSEIPYNRTETSRGVYSGSDKGPKLTPFPSYALNKERDCNALQTVQSSELDNYGRLWIVDSGRTELLTASPKNLCPAKLMVVDLTQGDRIVHTYAFPDEVVSRTSGIIKDLVVACDSRSSCMVYISNFGEGKLTVYDHARRTSWSVSHPSMLVDKNEQTFKIGGTELTLPFGITGLGLAPRNRRWNTLYFTSLSHKRMYFLPTSVLQNPNPNSNRRITLRNSDVRLYGLKRSQNDGMAMNCRSVLYYGDLLNDAVWQTQTGEGITQLTGAREFASSAQDLSFPDTWTFDSNGRLLITSTKFQNYPAKVNLEEENYKIIIFNNVPESKPYNAEYCR